MVVTDLQHEADQMVREHKNATSDPETGTRYKCNRQISFWILTRRRLEMENGETIFQMFFPLEVLVPYGE